MRRFASEPDKIISYLRFEHFDINNFEMEIKNMLIGQRISFEEFSTFKNIVLDP